MGRATLVLPWGGKAEMVKHLFTHMKWVQGTRALVRVFEVTRA